MLESYLSDEVKGRVLFQLDYVSAIAWSVRQGRPSPGPWTDRLDSDLFTTDVLHRLTRLWFPDVAPAAWGELPRNDRNRIARAFHIPPKRRTYFEMDVLHWPWAAGLSRAKRQALQLAWEHTAARDFSITLVWPYLILDDDDPWFMDRYLLSVAHALAALRAAVVPLGYADLNTTGREEADGQRSPDSPLAESAS